MSILLASTEVKLLKHCLEKKPSYYHTNGIMFDKTKSLAISIDGRKMACVPVEGIPEAWEEKTIVVFPETKSSQGLYITEDTVYAMSDKELTTEEAVFQNLINVSGRNPLQIIQGNFPKYEMLLPKPRKCLLTEGLFLDLSLLPDLGKAIKFVFNFGDSLAPVCIKIYRRTGKAEEDMYIGGLVIMPMKPVEKHNDFSNFPFQEKGEES